MLKIKKGGTLPLMNVSEFLYHVLFVEWDKGLWGIITLGVIFVIISIVSDWGYFENRDKQ